MGRLKKDQTRHWHLGGPATKHALTKQAGAGVAFSTKANYRLGRSRIVRRRRTSQISAHGFSLARGAKESKGSNAWCSPRGRLAEREKDKKAGEHEANKCTIY